MLYAFFKFWNENVVPTNGKLFTITNTRWNGKKKAGTVLEIQFQMKYKGNTSPIAKITSFVGKK